MFKIKGTPHGEANHISFESWPKEQRCLFDSNSASRKVTETHDEHLVREQCAQNWVTKLQGTNGKEKTATAQEEMR